MRPSGTHLYNRVCPSVRWSVRRSVGPLRLCKNRVSRQFLATVRFYTECKWSTNVFWVPPLLLCHFICQIVHLCLCISHMFNTRTETQSGRIVAELESMGVKKWSLWWASQKRHLISVYICFWISQFNFSYCLYLYYVGDFQALEISCLPVVMPILVVTLYRRCMTVADGVSMISALFGIYLVAQPNFIFHIFPESKTQPIM